MTNNAKRASMRPKNNDGNVNGAWMNRAILIPYREKWTFYDLAEWTDNPNIQSIVQAIVTGILRLDDYKVIEDILILGGLKVKTGPKEPLE